MTTTTLQEGDGEIFTPIDPDAMRTVFRAKDKSLKSKMTTARDAVSKFVHDGDYIAVGGFGGVRIPVALLHELIRQGRKELGFSGHVSTHDCQLLAAGECFNRCDAAYIVGLEARGLSPQARRVFESGNIRVTEWTNGTLSWRLKAAAMGLPFLPARSMIGTDTFKRSAAREMVCPFTGKKILAVPALYPDIALIHVHRADIHGNCQIDGILVADDDIAKASRRVIITTEEIVPSSELRRVPGQTCIPYWCVDAVVEMPYGSYPGNMPGCYFSDEEHLAEWLQIEKDPQAFQAFLRNNILDCTSFPEYIQRNGGIEKILALRRKENFIDRLEDA